MFALASHATVLMGSEKLGNGKAASPKIGLFSGCYHNNDRSIREAVGESRGGSMAYHGNLPLQFSP